MKKSGGIALTLTIGLLVGTAALAADVETPRELAGGKILTAAQAKDLVGKAHFFDMRKAVNYGRGHIPGAVALPYDQKSALSADFDASLDRLDAAQLPADKGAAVVFYSDGPTGWKSYKAAVLSIRDGYTNVMWFRGGTAEWTAAGYPLN
ncbi:MAG: rhodanese-like domain-containing protein [Thermodesulfobacteriota bacterium]